MDRLRLIEVILDFVRTELELDDPIDFAGRLADRIILSGALKPRSQELATDDRGDLDA